MAWSLTPLPASVRGMFIIAIFELIVPPLVFAGDNRQAAGADEAATGAVFDSRLHYAGQVWVTVSNDGSIGIGVDPMKDRQYLGIDWTPRFEFPPRSGNDYLLSASLVFGCARLADTIVSSNALGFGGIPFSFWSFASIVESSSLRSSQHYDPAARAEQEYFAVYSDTTVAPGDVDPVDLRSHVPIGIEVHQTSYAWSNSYASRFIIIDYWIKNIAEVPIRMGAVGLVVHAYVRGHLAPSSESHVRDITGFVRTAPGIIPGTLDTIDLAWIADNDGDPANDGKFAAYSVTGAMGVRVLRVPPGCRLSYNWWAYPDAVTDWGPGQRFNQPGSAGAIGEPRGDRSRFRMMMNGEIDYDQVYAAIDQSQDGWLPPLRDFKARELAGGASTNYMLSFGPLPDIQPGDSVPFTVALVAGQNFHTDPRNFADRFDPANPHPYLDHLSFKDLITNARWADWVFDNPGVDTDHDGIRGRAYLVNCRGGDSVGCDSVFYKGDGVPDWRGPQAPYAPQFELVTKPAQAILRWNGAFTETEADPLSRVRDFEGYRIYVGRFGTNDQLSLVASWDKVDYKRFAFQPSTNDWHQISNPLTISQWQEVLANPAFDPEQYAVPSPNEAYRDSSWDTTRNLEGDIIGVARHERFSYWAPEAANHPNQYVDDGRSETNIIQQVSTRDTVVDGGTLTYGVYEVTLDNLLPSLPLYFAVTTFDFGDFKNNLDPMESSPANNSQYGEPIYSSNVVSDSGLHVSVYPNPYKSVYNDAFGNRTTYSAEGYEGRGKVEFTEYDRRIHFINLPDTATIRIYSLDGDLIRELHHPDPHLTTYSSSLGWDLVSRNAMAVTSGIYIWRVDSRLGTQIGKLVIIK